MFPCTQPEEDQSNRVFYRLFTLFSLPGNWSFPYTHLKSTLSEEQTERCIPCKVSAFGWLCWTCVCQFHWPWLKQQLARAQPRNTGSLFVSQCNHRVQAHCTPSRYIAREYRNSSQNERPHTEYEQVRRPDAKQQTGEQFCQSESHR